MKSTAKLVSAAIKPGGEDYNGPKPGKFQITLEVEIPQPKTVAQIEEWFAGTARGGAKVDGAFKNKLLAAFQTHAKGNPGKLAKEQQKKHGANDCDADCPIEAAEEAVDWSGWVCLHAAAPGECENHCLEPGDLAQDLIEQPYSANRTDELFVELAEYEKVREAYEQAVRSASGENRHLRDFAQEAGLFVLLAGKQVYVELSPVQQGMSDLFQLAAPNGSGS